MTDKEQAVTVDTPELLNLVQQWENSKRGPVALAAWHRIITYIDAHTAAVTAKAVAEKDAEIAGLRGALAVCQAKYEAADADRRVQAAAPVAAMPKDTPKSMAESNARFAIDGAIQYGREGRNKPPSDDHWLMEYWLIGQQLRELGKTGWDNRTPLDSAEKAALATPQQHAQAALSDEWIKETITAAVQTGRVSWLGFERDEDGKYTIPSLSPYHYQIARAILAASQQPAAALERSRANGNDAPAVQVLDEREIEDQIDALLKPLTDQFSGLGELGPKVVRKLLRAALTKGQK
jgi:hypothetical protein